METAADGARESEGGGPVVRRGVPEGSAARVAALYWEAFGRKLGPALNPPDTGRAFIAAHLHHDRGVVALSGGRVVGVAGYRLGRRALTGGGVREVLSAYGMLRGLPRLAVLALLERTPDAGELVMDGIAVDAAHRGKGTGGLLLREIAAVAAENRCHRVRLDVIDTNPRARALYERHGFTAHRTEQTPYLRGLMGFGAVTTMHRPVTAADVTSRRKTP
ncbi:GNAT family N-acetyltransferase [Streptomyces spongiicola]|uniref:GNAT family N-acetyltransferase n=1 Tax=Streptomyces spongiicola TaxID=1690221 RepID=A0A2S1YU46_9ACTN|nr:GNAT family N-acetyltransferase [Streptomyces spongiicola]AWK07619.1 molybdopterin-guanine dinucleotide biosynthesis protein MobC [Streptomyces spongiicola]GBQ02543.1 GNAT family N-acetyltransferase [Streptomyces spongiicola]